MGFIPYYSVRHFHHDFRHWLAIIMISYDQRKKSSFRFNSRDLGNPNCLCYLATSNPAITLAPSPTTLETATPILTTTLFLTFTAADSHSVPTSHITLQPPPPFLPPSWKTPKTIAPRQPTKSGKDKYTIILPTNNDRKNLPMIA